MYDSVTELLIRVWRSWPRPALALLILTGFILGLYIVAAWWLSRREENRELAEVAKWQKESRL